MDGAAKYGQLLDQTYAGITRTGYYLRKTWGEQSVNNKTTPQYTDPIIRLGELYLNYAEAANEAYGPNGMAPGASMTALQALNKIRARAEMPNVLNAYVGSKDLLRQRIKNERTIELCFEGSHYFHDIRRWKDAPEVMTGTLFGVDVEKVPVSKTYPTGFKYTRQALPATRQTKWKDAMYYLPFNTDDTYTALAEEVDRFCRQEAQHYQQHERFNALIFGHDYPGLRERYELLRADFERMLTDEDDRYRIGFVEGFEANTTQGALFLLGSGVLEHPKTHKAFGELWTWHMLEEIEHRNVAFDAYQHLFGF